MVGAYSDVNHRLENVGQKAFGWELTMLSDGRSKGNKLMGLPGFKNSIGEGPWLTAHGFIFFGAWTLLGSLMLITNRYLTHKWAWRQKVHTVGGWGIILLTLVGWLIGFGAIDGWHVYMNYPHVICANPTVVIGVSVAVGGIVAKLKRDKTALPEMDWRSGEFLTYVKFHRYAGYFILLLAQVTMTIGICCYWWPDYKTLIWGFCTLNLIIFVLPLAVLEIKH